MAGSGSNSETYTLIEVLRRLLQPLGVPGVLAFHTPMTSGGLDVRQGRPGVGIRIE